MKTARTRKIGGA